MKKILVISMSSVLIYIHINMLIDKTIRCGAKENISLREEFKTIFME